jgi:hypothetical protein
VAFGAAAERRQVQPPHPYSQDSEGGQEQVRV